MPNSITNAQYQELLSKSVSFREMSSDEKQKIVSAIDDDRANYVTIFQEEITMLEKASADFLAQNDAIVNQFKVDVKKDKQLNLKKAEKKAETVDNNQAENLLKQITDDRERFQQFVLKLESPIIKMILGEDMIAKYKQQFADANEKQLIEATAKLNQFEEQANENEKANEEKTKVDVDNLNRIITEIGEKQLEKAKQMAGQEDTQQLNSIESQLNNI